MWQFISQLCCLPCRRGQLGVRSASGDAREPGDTSRVLPEDNLELSIIYATVQCPTAVTVATEECVIGGREQVSSFW